MPVGKIRQILRHARPQPDAGQETGLGNWSTSQIVRA
jgi:hypothetical protein